jgi:hypothetical protein
MTTKTIMYSVDSTSITFNPCLQAPLCQTMNPAQHYNGSSYTTAKKVILMENKITSDDS